MKIAYSLLAAFLIAAGCSHPSAKMVVVIEKTGSYHREGCPKVMMARTRLESLAQAQRDRRRACPYCKPDQSL